MIRYPSNPNLTLHYDSMYLGLPVQFDKGPFVREYLQRLYQTVTCAINEYRRVFAFRFDLRLPIDRDSTSLCYENEIIDRFVESFKAKIRHNRKMAFRESTNARDTTVRYVWTRECGQQGRPHYHLAILLNGDAFCSLGKFSPNRDNMFNRLQEAWASALNLPIEEVRGLVEVPANHYYHLYRDNNESIAKFFFRASYLCKSATKSFVNGSHGFGASRS